MLTLGKCVRVLVAYLARTSMAEEAVYSDSELELDAASSGISSLLVQQGSRPSTPRFSIRCRPMEVRSDIEDTIILMYLFVY